MAKERRLKFIKAKLGSYNILNSQDEFLGTIGKSKVKKLFENV